MVDLRAGTKAAHDARTRRIKDAAGSMSEWLIETTVLVSMNAANDWLRALSGC